MQAVLGVLQHYRGHTFLDSVLTVKISSAVYGNIAQPNHYANYLVLGLISLGLLYKHWSLRAWQVALLAAPLLFVLVLRRFRAAPDCTCCGWPPRLICGSARPILSAIVAL